MPDGNGEGLKRELMSFQQGQQAMIAIGGIVGVGIFHLTAFNDFPILRYWDASRTRS